MTPDYSALWASVTIPAARRAEVDRQAQQIVAHADQYRAVGMGIPWWWIGCIHWREADGDFTKHLHNGDPLSARTVHVPAGRPLIGRPPFSWVLSAQDALAMRGLDKVVLWPIPKALAQAETFNGTGYQQMGILSPYVWGATNHQRPGKFIADHKFDATVVDAQVGVAAMMRSLMLAGVSLGAPTPIPVAVVGHPAAAPTPVAPPLHEVTTDDLNDAEMARIRGA